MPVPFLLEKTMNKKIIISMDNVSKTNGGIFEGWGTSLCWWAHRLGFSQKLIKDSADLFFSKNGLSLNIMRYNIGGGDDPSHNHIRRTDSEIPGWLRKNENGKFVYDFTADEKQLCVLKAAYIAAGEDAFVEAFSNSPPYFMTVSGCSSGSKNAVSTNLKKSCVTDFADYLTDVTAYIVNVLGIRVKSLAAMNEPYTCYWKAMSEKQEGCHISPGKRQSELLVAVAEHLKIKHLDDVTVTASDETNTSLQLKAFKKLSKEALGVIGRISTHTYKKATPKIGTFAREMGYNLWMSETDWSSKRGEDAKEMGPALFLSEKILEDMNTLSPSGWVIWQVVAGYISRYPDEKGRYDMPCLPDLNEGYWGCAFADIDKEEIYLTQKYYAFGQFSRYIRPGMTIIHTGKSSLCAFDKKNNSLSLVCVNSKKADSFVNIDFSSFGIPFTRVKAIRTSGSMKDGEHWAELGTQKIDGNCFDFTLKGNSITTFIIE